MQDSVEEIRFVKAQQWRPVYYALLIFSAIVAISVQMSHAPISFAPWAYCWLNGLTIAVVALVAVASTIIQVFHHIALQEYRKEPGITRTPWKTFQTWIFTGTFLLLIWLGAAIAAIVVISVRSSV